EIARALNAAGVMAICAVPGSTPREREQARATIGSGRFLLMDAARLPGEIPAAAQEVCRVLREAGYLGEA
ncbi:MAG TPA: hypothetical protein VEH47_01095, partial [Candidatus Acidoferrales bacterium]|nr:hypothetical protein [Candidatus Acidoferrales bacterium]